MGFGLGVGSILASIIFLAIGAIIFFLGWYLVKSQNKKPEKEQNNPTKYFGFFLMFIGMLVGMGFGASQLFLLAGEEFLE